MVRKIILRKFRNIITHLVDLFEHLSAITVNRSVVQLPKDRSETGGENRGCKNARGFASPEQRRSTVPDKRERDRAVRFVVRRGKRGTPSRETFNFSVLADKARHIRTRFASFFSALAQTSACNDTDSFLPDRSGTPART